MNTDWAGAFGWGMDFCRAMRERPLWARLLFRVVLGRYAYREFIGLQNHIAREGYGPFDDYGLENVSYHADPVPFAWWRERPATPKKAVAS
jgi:hypothetical protein